MKTYTIYLGATPIKTTDGTEYAYAVWRKTKELADLINTSACLVWDETGEVIEDFDPDQLENVGDPDENDDFDGFVDYSDESGFDPYMGCYTGDC